MADESIVETGGGLVKKGAFTDSGNRKSFSVGLGVGIFTVWRDRYELMLMMLGVIIGEEASVGEGMLPTDLIDSSPAFALVGMILGLVTGHLLKVGGVI